MKVLCINTLVLDYEEHIDDAFEKLYEAFAEYYLYNVLEVVEI